MKTKKILQYVTGPIGFKRSSSVDWVLPASIGLGIGIAAGIGVGLLLAPAPGVETRKQLRDGAMRVGEKAKSFARREKHFGSDFSTSSANSFLNEVGDIR